MKRILKYLLPTMMGLTLLGCNQDDAIVLTDNSLNKTLTKIVVSADTTKPSGVDGFNVPINNSLTLIATAEYSDSTTQNITQYVAWQVSNLDIGSIEDNIFTAKKTGNVTITASYRDIVSENSVKINVLAELVSIEVTPATKSTPLGQTVQMIATGTFTDGSVDELTGVNWTSNPTGIVTLSANGLATPVAVGSTTIKAAKDGKEDTTTSFEVTAAELVSIEVTPATKSTPLGQTVQMIATGTFTDGSVDELTGVNWTSNPTGIVTLSANGLATPVAVGSTTIKAAKDGKEDTTTSFEVTAAELVSIEVTPATKSTPLGQTVQMIATGTFTDGSVDELTGVNWTSNPTGIVTLSANGLATPVAVGSTTIKAAKDGKEDTTTSFEVTAAELVSIEVTPATKSTPLGQTVQMIATGTFTDGSVDELTGVNWTSNPTGIVTLSANGLATPVAVGSTTIKAAKDGKEDTTTSFEVTAAELVSIEVTPATKSTPLGQTVQMIATGTFTDGSVDELTGVNWTSNPTGIVTLSANGLATPVAVGSTTIKAAKDGKEDTTTSFEVTAAELVSIEVTPATKSTPLGQTVQMIATGTFTDGSVDELTGVNWTSNPTGIVTLSANGLATPVAVGSTTIKAAKDGKEDTTTSFEVTAAELVSIEVTPATKSTPLGQTVQMIATGTFTDGSVDELTGVNWTSNPTGIVTLSANGLATPVAVGSTTIKAAKDGKEDTTTSFEVTAAELVSIEVTPATKSTPLGQTVQMIATGTFTDGSVDELTGVNWTSNPTGIVTLSANGLATPVAVGSTTIKAAKDGKEDTTTSFEVTAPPQPSVTSVTITPLSVSKSKTDLGCVSFSATANYSNNTTKSISTTASSELQSCGSNAYRVGAYTGVFSVRAVADGKSASASFTVY